MPVPIGAYAGKGMRGPKGTRLCHFCRVIHKPQRGTVARMANGRQLYCCTNCAGNRLWWCPGCDTPYRDTGYQAVHYVPVPTYHNLLVATGGIPAPFFHGLPRIPKASQLPSHMCRVCNACTTRLTLCIICGRYSGAPVSREQVIRTGPVCCDQRISMCEGCAALPSLVFCFDCGCIATTTTRVQREADGTRRCTVCSLARRTEIHHAYPLVFVVNKSKRLVGYELEFYLPMDARLGVTNWGRLHSDASIRPEGATAVGREFASFPFSGDHLFKVLTDSTQHIIGAGGAVNRSCGVHTHFCVALDTDEQRNNLTEWWPVLEPLFAGMVESRRRTNDYCTLVSKVQNRHDRYDSRYRALNTQAFMEHGTYEVRLHHGSLDSNELIGWVQVMLGFFDGFRDIEAKDALIKAVSHLSPRGKLLYFMQRGELSLKVRQHCIKRFMQYGLGTEGYDAKYLNKQGKEVLHLEEGVS